MRFRVVVRALLLGMALGLCGCGTPKTYKSAVPMEDANFATFVESLDGSPQGRPEFDPGFEKDVRAGSGWTLSGPESIEEAFKKFSDDLFSKWCAAHGGEYSIWKWRPSRYGISNLVSNTRGAKLAIADRALNANAPILKVVAQCQTGEGPYLVTGDSVLPGGALAQDRMRATFFEPRGLKQIASAYEEKQAEAKQRRAMDAAKREARARLEAIKRRQFQDQLKPGARAKQGLILEVNRPLALVQRCISYTVGAGCSSANSVWMPIADLSPAE